jgi:hypothetical protein
MDAEPARSSWHNNQHLPMPDYGQMKRIKIVPPAFFGSAYPGIG